MAPPPRAPGVPQTAPIGAADLVPQDALDQLRAQLPPSFSKEVDERGNTVMGGAALPSLQQDVGAPATATPEQRGALTAMYGESFPLLKEGAPKDDDWAKWGVELWSKHASGVRSRLHLNQRNRLFRKGIQWISSLGLGPWREPPRPRDSARIVDNLIAAALDQRVQIIAEQRPGFQTRPSTQDPADFKKAEAQQFALEYQYDQQQMPDIIRELVYWAGTDGVSFGEVYWDADAGPWHEVKEVSAQVESAQSNPHDDHALQRFPMGDVKTRVLRMEQVRVSADATSTRKPWYWVCREVIPKSRAIKEYGLEVGGKLDDTGGEAQNDINITQALAAKGGYLLPSEDELFQEQPTVDRLTVYCEPSEYLEKGLTLVTVGNKVVFIGPLLFGVVPLFRLTDGSSDPAFFPTAIMDAWIDVQMRINAIKSKWVENVRFNAGAKLLARENAIAGETLTGGTMSVIAVKGIGSVSDSVKPLEGFSLGGDAKELLALEKKAFEDLSGWNDVSRGSFSADQSGRAILAIREQLERVFAPAVQAAARGITAWAKISINAMHWGYDLPRTVGTVGAARPDLARELVTDDFDGVADVFVDPETLMPMPRALRLFLLKDLAQMGVINPQEYRRRLPFAWTRSIITPDQDQEARGRRVVESIRKSGNPEALPLLWQDNEAIHQDILERELILPDDTPPPVRDAAQKRWQALAEQSKKKLQPPPVQPKLSIALRGDLDPYGVQALEQGGIPGYPQQAPLPQQQAGQPQPQQPGGPPQAQGGPQPALGQGATLPPDQAPVGGTGPIAGAPIVGPGGPNMSGPSMQEQAAGTFEQTQPH